MTVVVFRCFDLETTGVDIDTTEVVQAAVVDMADNYMFGMSREMRFFAASIPAGAAAVHGIHAEDVAHCEPFSAVARAFVTSLAAPGVVSVSFNGTGFDIPVVARIAATMINGWSAADCEQHLRERHIDVMRLWARARSMDVKPPWDGFQDYGSWLPSLTASMFAGSLAAAHGFWLGEGFDGAHDAEADCKATLRVLTAMLREGFVDVQTAIKWSNEPLPGDVDFSGKFKWDGDSCVLSFGKHKGTPIEQVDHGFLQWMLRNDFPADSKQLVQNFLKGQYPQRNYEAEAEQVA